MASKDGRYTKVSYVVPGSVCDEIGVQPGDILLRINGNPIMDVFEYRILELPRPDMAAPACTADFQDLPDEDEDDVLIDIVSSEARDYLKSIGYFDFKKSDSIRVYVSTNGDKENLKLTNLCSTPDFLVSYGNDTGKSNKSLLNPIFVTVKTDYPGGNILCNVKLSNIYIKRGEFEETQPGEMGNVTAFLDTSEIKTEYINYQNYGSYNSVYNCKAKRHNHHRLMPFFYLIDK